jgi:hypothetical protein
LVVTLALGIATWHRVRSAGHDPAVERPTANSEDGEHATRNGRDAAPGTTGTSATKRLDDGSDSAAADAGRGVERRGSTAEEQDPPAGSDALGNSAEPAGPRAIYLQAEAPGEGRLSTRVRGVDTGAPRALVLWRVQDGRRVRLAEGFSTPDGALQFPDVLVPDQLELVVTAAEAGPEGTDESDPARLEAGVLRPPQLQIRRAQGGALAVRVAASRALGSVVFAGPAGEEIARVALPRTPSPARQLLDVTLPADRVGAEILVAHELPDGARSAWRPYRVPPVPPAGDPELDESGTSDAPAS